ncbi:prepilin peptidase [Nesterenkonia sp. NBAIMH1]|uniref:prepilin peptidase n=1 Tax=Nesterenkonia sp. NBAIMH1 TaxID=2600320 RepID=UPI00143DECFF|nr:prepilin peptidase [Nesterenkonia sp. NBAIMH1]
MVEQIEELLSSGSGTGAGVVLLIIGAICLICAVLLSIVDVREHRLPNTIVYPWAAVSAGLFIAVAALTGDAYGLLRGIVAGILWSLGFMAVRLIFASAVGLGDVKLAFILGLHSGFFGWSSAVLAVASTLMLAGLAVLTLLALRRAEGRSRLPLGPFMLTGTAAALLLG